MVVIMKLQMKIILKMIFIMTQIMNRALSVSIMRTVIWDITMIITPEEMDVVVVEVPTGR